MKEYVTKFNLKDARTKFALRSMMLPTIQMNFKNKNEFKRNDYKCICGNEDHQSHLISCPSYAFLRVDLDILNSDQDLVSYYQLIVEERRKDDD